MRVGFLANQIDNRGTGNAMFDYADYNEKYLGNESKIYTFSTGRHNSLAEAKYKERFGEIHDIENVGGIDTLYHIKSGEDDGLQRLLPDDITYAVHAVFHSQPHGDKYAVVSKWMGIRDSLPFVPHYISNDPYPLNMRSDLQIPPEAFVFSRYGGYDTFDLPFVWDAISWSLETYDDVWFLFANTEPVLKHERIIYLPEMVERIDKSKFINTADAMLHARQRGETFGIAVGEFAARNVPILTYTGSPEKSHLYELQNVPHYGYEDGYTAMRQMQNVKENPPYLCQAYLDYTGIPKVMDKFKEVFLDD